MIHMEQGEEKKVDPLLQSKTRIPELPGGAISRAILIEGLKKRPEEVIILQAGAGFGKTTAMAELARKYDGHCGWYHTDEMDNNLENFILGISSAISSIMNLNIPELQEFGQKEEDMYSAYHRFLSVFLLELKEDIFYICIDDFQVVSNEQVYQFLVNLIEYGREKIRLFLTVKGSFPQFLATYIMQGRALVVGAEQLRFAGGETSQLLRKIVGTKLPEKLVEKVQEYMAGWPAGIVFAALGIKKKPPEKDEQLFFDTTYLYDYIFYEIFRKLSCDIQIFLTETSILEELEPAVCNYVLGRSDSEYMLEFLFRENLFLSKVNERQNEYRYHSVFAGFLQKRILPERKESILYRMTEFYTHKKAEKEEEGALLQVRCLGELDITGAQGQVIFRTRKTKELFACLFYEEGRGIKKDTLMERLWPEMCTEKASVLFHTTVSYLRKALREAGAEEVFVVKNQTYAVKISHIRSDIKTLLDWDRQIRGGTVPEDGNMLELAELYHECYMYGEDYAWLGEYREYVEQIFLQIMDRLAKIQMEKGQYRKAILFLEKAVQVDNYAVPLLELLVECLILTRDAKGAKREYAKMRRICEEELCQEAVMEFKDYIKKAERRRGRMEC